MTGMREELKKTLQERVRLDESTSERVVEVVMAYFKEKGLSLLTGSGASGGAGCLDGCFGDSATNGQVSRGWLFPVPSFLSLQTGCYNQPACNIR